jgi:hypothetical protein
MIVINTLVARAPSRKGSRVTAKASFDHSRVLALVCSLAWACACSGSGGAGDGGLNADASPFDPDSGEPMPPDDPGPGEGAVLPEVGLVFPDGEVAREPFPGFPEDQPPPADAPAITNATLDGTTGMLSFDLEVEGDTAAIEFQIQFPTGEIVQFGEPVSDAVLLPIENIVPGWTFEVINQARPWASAFVLDCWDQSGLTELTEGCFPTCVTACTPPPECSKWFCPDMGLDEASCATWMQTETAGRFGGDARGKCMSACSHEVALLDFHRSGGTRASHFFLDGDFGTVEPEAMEQASLATADALLAQTSPEAVAANYIEVVFEQLYCGAFEADMHESLWGYASGLNCLSNGEGTWEVYDKDPNYETYKNYLLCALDGELPDLPDPPPPASPRKSKRVYRQFMLQGFTMLAGGSIMVAKDGSIVSQTAPVEVMIPAQGSGL